MAKEGNKNNFNVKMDSAILNNIVKQVLKENADIHGLSETFIDNFNILFKRNKDSETGIKISEGDDGYIFDLYLIVKYGVKIPQLAWDLQSQIKTAVEKKFGTTVSKVNIHIQGVTSH